MKVEEAVLGSPSFILCNSSHGLRGRISTLNSNCDGLLSVSQGINDLRIRRGYRGFTT